MVATTVPRSSAVKVDQNGLRFNQAMIVLLTLVAFVLGTGSGGAWIVLLTGLSMAIGAALPGRGPFQLLYRHVLLPTGVVKARPEEDDPTPHRVAQSMGAVCLTLSAILLFAGFGTAGWVLAWIVVALALVNLLFGFCTGCFIFLNLNRLMAR
jgi:hypothetical protein